jgi:hypothetical protein
VTFLKDKFFALGSSGSIFTSSDIVNWTLLSSGVTIGLRSCAYGNATFMIAGYDGSESRILTSSDGLTWTQNYFTSEAGVHSLIFGNNQFIGVGSRGAIMTSLNGMSWDTMTSGITNTLNSVAFGDNMFIAVGNEGAILTSLADKTGVRPYAGHFEKSINRNGVYTVNGRIRVVFRGSITSGLYTFDILAATGKRIRSFTRMSTNGNFDVPLKGVGPGKYVLVVSDKKRGAFYSSIMVMR